MLSRIYACTLKKLENWIEDDRETIQSDYREESSSVASFSSMVQSDAKFGYGMLV